MVTTICPSRETLFQYSIGMLNGPERDALNDHLESCSDCQATIMTLDDTDDTVVGRLRMPSNDSFMDEPQLQAALKAAMELPLHTKGPFSPSEPSAEMRKTFGEYQILEELGRGGMGRVYKARHTKLNRVVAVKLLARPKLDDPQAINRFEREMQAVGLLDHQNIVQAHDAREIDDMPVLIMEFIDGLDLAELVRRIGPLPIADACELIRRTALALQYAHEHGLVHRDIKPSNIMLSKAGEVKLLDLGLARFYVEAVAGEEMTGSGQAMGTADYMAPEQASDSRTVDIRADIYSLGCTLYKFLSGRTPFSGPEYRGTLDKMNAHVHETPLPLKQFVPELPDELATIIDRMLSKNPADRFATPSEVAAAMEPFCTGAALTELITRAMSLPRESWAKAEKTNDANRYTPRLAAAPNRRRPIVKYLLIGLAFFGVIALSFGAGVWITINRNGETHRLNVPNNSQTDIDENGNATVNIGNKSIYDKQYAVNPAAEMKALQGQWKVVRVEKGKDADPLWSIYSNQDLNIDEMDHWDFQKWVLVFMKTENVGGLGLSYSIDPTSAPKTIDIRGNGSSNTIMGPFVALGIYEVEGDRLKICVARYLPTLKTEQRPRTFSIEPDSSNVLFVLERVIQPAQAPAPGEVTRPISPSLARPAITDERSIQGTWEVASSSLSLLHKMPDAKDISDDQIQKTAKVIITQDQLKIAGPHVTDFAFAYRLNPNAKTKMIDLQTGGEEYGLLAYGIYSLEGDELKICTSPLAPSVRTNPTTGETEPPDARIRRPGDLWSELGSGKELLVLRRAGKATVSEDEKNIQGTWRVESSSNIGISGFNANQQVQFTRNEIIATIAMAGGGMGGLESKQQWDFKLGYACDPTANPKRIDIANFQQPGMLPVHGVYELQGDTLTINWGMASNSSGLTDPIMPSSLSPTPQTTLVTLKRVSPATQKTSSTQPPAVPAVDPAAEWKALQGPWKVKSIGKGKESDQAWGRIADDGNPLDPATTDRFDFDKSQDPPLHLVRPSRNSLARGVEVNFHTSGSLKGFYYSIDPTAMPKRINLLIKDVSPTGTDLGKKLIAAGIYKIEEDQLTICLRAALSDIDSPQWPTDFAVDPDSGGVLYVFQRHRPSEDEKAIQNSWTLINRLVDGKPDMLQPSSRGIQELRFGKENYFYFETSDPIYGDYFLDSEKQPKAITLYDYKNQKPDKNGIHGIYQFDGEKLLIAYRQDGKAPEKFESTPGSGVTLLELKRSEHKPAGEGVPAPDDSKKKSEQSGKAAEKTQKSTLPDLRLSGTEVTAEAISRLADRHWGTVTLAQAKLDGAVIEPLRRAASISSLRLFGTDLSGQILRLQNVHGLTALEIGAPLRGLDFEALAKLTQLERLSLPQDLTINVIGAHEIAELVNLKSLRLYGVNIDDACFVELRPLIHLEELDLSNTQITDEGLSILEKMPHLRTLELERHNIVKPQLTDACLLPISRLLELERLSLSGKITDAGLVQVSKLPKLKSLSILSTKITGEGLKALEHSTVEDLTLSSDQLSHAMSEPALVNFAKCRSLKRVFVNGQISEADMLKYQRSLPNISWSFNM